MYTISQGGHNHQKSLSKANRKIQTTLQWKAFRSRSKEKTVKPNGSCSDSRKTLLLTLLG
ncbi:MAG: hypothetical protein CMI26_01600 [Opitutae bacterium]|nr:hypothetical protein [Opitutae bacterium]